MANAITDTTRPCVVHLDLKGLPPTSERLIELLDVFAAAGYNAVLVEWEDAFPWTVDERFRSPTAYSRETVRRFVERAAALGLELIPLIQCIGHMETVLAIETYAHLREQPDRYDVMNVLAPGARQIVEAMVDDVLTLMPDVRWFHLGGDEAWTFGTHPQTRAYAQEHGKDRLYLQHVEPTLDKLVHRNIRPLLWHDMMIDWDEAALRALGAKADLVVWGYVGHPNDADHHFNTRYIERFHALGMPLWAAGAYKGADGMSEDLPHVETRMTNARAWRELDERFHFRGLIATAWSRYSTHRVQNEPIEGALDAMVRVGHLLRSGSELDEQAVRTILQQAGEAEHHEQLRAALANLSRLRHAAWDNLQQAMQNRALTRQRPQRCSSGSAESQLQGLSRHVEELDECAAAVRTAMTGLVEPTWVEEYLVVRIEPLREAVANMRAEQTPVRG